VLTSDRFVGARALLEPERLRTVLLTRAEPAAIGMTALGGLLDPVAAADQCGLLLELGDGGTAVNAPIAPGHYRPVSVRCWRRIELEEVVEIYEGAPRVHDYGMDLGLTGLAPMGWNWWLVKEGTPEERVERLREAMGKALAKESVRERILEIGFVPTGYTPDEYDEVAGSVESQLRQAMDAIQWERDALAELEQRRAGLGIGGMTEAQPSRRRLQGELAVALAFMALGGFVFYEASTSFVEVGAASGGAMMNAALPARPHSGRTWEASVARRARSPFNPSRCARSRRVASLAAVSQRLSRSDTPAGSSTSMWSVVVSCTAATKPVRSGTTMSCSSRR